jgi:hypothetical protein
MRCCTNPPVQLVDVCDGLMYLHSEGLVHGDLNKVRAFLLLPPLALVLKFYERTMS